MTFTQAQISALPTATVASGTPLRRIHRVGRGPWHFSRGPGRFDPVAAEPPLGACYAAGDELAAFVEVYRRTRLISEPEIQARRVSTLSVSRDLILVDLTSRGAALRGPDTSALASTWDYALPQAFASAAAAAGYDGVRYFARHDPAKELVCQAVFGHGDDPTFTHGPSRPLPKRLLQQARAEFGYRIVPVP